MARCRVTFRDLEHQLCRRVEVDAESPVDAAQAALQWMLENHHWAEDFEPFAKVEVITTEEHFVPIRVPRQCPIRSQKAEAA